MSNHVPLTSVNGVFGAPVSPFDRGFCYGDGVFETCLYRAGALPLWELHRERLLVSCKALHIPLRAALLDTQLGEMLSKILTLQAVEGVLKVIVTRGVGGRGYALPDEAEPTIFIVFFDSVPKAPPAAKLRICRQRLSRNTSLAGLKHLNRLEQILARAEWQGQDHDEGIMLDEDGSVIEATASNVFIVKDEQLFTPDLTFSGVAGVMRRAIIEVLAPPLRSTVEIKKISLSDLANADEVFLTSSVRGITRVALLDAEIPVHFGQNKITQLLQDQARRLLHGGLSETN